MANRDVHVHVEDDSPRSRSYDADPYAGDRYAAEREAEAASFFTGQLLWVLLIALLVVAIIALFATGAIDLGGSGAVEDVAPTAVP